jgi:hypothetical protein
MLEILNSVEFHSGWFRSCIRKQACRVIFVTRVHDCSKVELASINCSRKSVGLGDMHYYLHVLMF